MSDGEKFGNVVTANVQKSEEEMEDFMMMGDEEMEIGTGDN